MNKAIEVCDVLNDIEFKILPVIAERAINKAKTDSKKVLIDVTDILDELKEYQTFCELFAQDVEYVEI